MKTNEIITARAAELAKETWEWTEEREKCLDLFLKGQSKSTISKTLGRARNTIIAWCDNPAFLDRANELELERRQALTQRRMRTTSSLTEKISGLAQKAIDAAVSDPTSNRLRYAAREWLSEFRLMTMEERINHGENVQRSETRIGIAGIVQHVGSTGPARTIDGKKPLNKLSFREFLEEGAITGVIDASLVPLTDPQAAVTSMVQQLFIDGDLSDRLKDEDRAFEEAQAAERK